MNGQLRRRFCKQLKVLLFDLYSSSNTNKVFWSPCPENWMLIKQKCYLLNTDATVSFDAAQAYCFNQGGKLFEPTYNGIDEAVRTQGSFINHVVKFLGIFDPIHHIVVIFTK